MSVKELIVVGGPNGAGKTTFALQYAAKHNLTYISADAIAEQLSSGSLEDVRIQASRKFLQTLDSLLGESESFVIESTLSGRTFADKLKRAQADGFVVSVFYLFLDSVEDCVSRVRMRVQKGGHNVPEEDIRRRFIRSARNFWDIYRLLSDCWILEYNSESEIQDVAFGTRAYSAMRNRILFDRFQVLLDGMH